MFLQINTSDDMPIYEQVVRQIKFAIAGHALREGEMIPSVRDLARDLTINPNTVARAYRQLQNEGVLQAIRGTGMAVAAGAERRCRADRTELIRTRLRGALLEATGSQVPIDQLRALVDEELAAVAEQARTPAVDTETG